MTKVVDEIPVRNGKRRAVIMALALIADAVFSAVSGCQGCQGSPPPDARVQDAKDAEPDPGTGTISLASSMIDLSGSPIGCDRINPGETLLRMRSASGSPDESKISLPCAISSVTSPPVAAGIYNVTPELNSSGELLATAPDQNNVAVWSGIDTMMLPVKFIVDATGGLALSIKAGPTSSNCQPIAQGGAGITSTTITLTHPGGCTPISLIRKRGDLTIGQYLINCSTPMAATCIETDETLTASELSSGPYTIHITGRFMARECWKHDGPLQVPAGERVLTTTLILNDQGIPGCPHP